MDKPNWKNENDYPPVDGTSWDRWAWEFLKRNSEFSSELSQAQREDELAERTNPIEWRDTHTGEVLAKWGISFPVMRVLGLPVLEEWHEYDSPVTFKKYPIRLPTMQLDNGLDIRFSSYDKTKIPLEFDLTAPILPQLKEAEGMLNRMQNWLEKNQGVSVKDRNNETAKLFPRYLRLLDSQLENVSQAELANFFMEGEDRINKQLTKAEYFRNGGYLTLMHKR